MTLSRRDRRIGIYTYANTGREGVIVDTWTLAGTYWGRVDDYHGSSRMVAGAPEIAVDSVIQLSDENYVAPNSIAVDGTLLLSGAFNLDGAQMISGQPGSGTSGVYRIDRLLRKRMHRVQLLYAQRINRNSVNLTALVLDGAFILDGSAVLGGILSS